VVACIPDHHLEHDPSGRCIAEIAGAGTPRRALPRSVTVFCTAGFLFHILRFRSRREECRARPSGRSLRFELTVALTCSDHNRAAKSRSDNHYLRRTSADPMTSAVIVGFNHE